MRVLRCTEQYIFPSTKSWLSSAWISIAAIAIWLGSSSILSRFAWFSLSESFFFCSDWLVSMDLDLLGDLVWLLRCGLVSEFKHGGVVVFF